MSRAEYSDPGAGGVEPRAQAFEGLRPRLLGLAYRMLGTMAEAEDVVQDAYLRFHAAEDVEEPERWLVTVTTRLAIDQLRRAARQRQQYKGPWLPEPVATGGSSPFGAAALADDLSMAFLTLMERLAPAERAAFLLREVFDYSYAELAAMLEKSEVACRQLVSRARQRIRSDRRRFTADADAHRRLAEGFARAAASGDLGMLEQVLHEDVVMVGDGGGKALSALRPILGAEKVSRFFRGVLPKAPPGTAYEVRELNGEAAVVLTLGGIPYQTIAFDLVEGEVRALYIVRNPDKLRRLAPADSPS